MCRIPILEFLLIPLRHRILRSVESQPDFNPPWAQLVHEVDEELGAFADKSLGLWRLADVPVRELTT